jgi:uncharacterized protein YfbU (UPF0304 family)
MNRRSERVGRFRSLRACRRGTFALGGSWSVRFSYFRVCPTLLKGMPMKLSDGEKLILTMLCDLSEHLKVNGEIDPSFVRSALNDDQTWGIPWKYRALFSEPRETPSHVEVVLDVLGMWDLIEVSYDALKDTDKKRIEIEAAPFGTDVRFWGFDGNNETEYLAVADFLVEKLERFERFKGRVVNSHMPSLETYSRLLSAYKPLRASLHGRLFNTDEIIQILKEMTHPSQRQ